MTETVLKLILKELIIAKTAKKVAKKQQPNGNATSTTATDNTTVGVTTPKVAALTVPKEKASLTATTALTTAVKTIETVPAMANNWCKSI